MATSHFTEDQLMGIPSIKKNQAKTKKETWIKVKLNGVDCMVSSLGRYGIILQSSMNWK